MMSVYGIPTKKDLKAAIGRRASEVLMETSLFGPELKDTGTVYVVGPAPHSRKWYAEVRVANGGIVAVK